MRNLLAVPLFKAEPNIINNDRASMENTVDDIVPSQPMPKAHDQEIDQIGNLRQVDPIFDPPFFHGQKGKPHEDEIPEPE